MDANVVDLQALFGRPISYRIPQFQRPYAWKRDDQWIPLWEDVRNIAGHWHARQDGQRVRPHFMGAIVLQRQAGSGSGIEKKLVVDGQQRLTTLQLLIRAAQEVFQSLDDTERATRLEHLTTNERSYWGGDNDNQTKIRQSNRNDHLAFLAAITQGENDERVASTIRGAYRYFKDAVNEWVDEEPAGRARRCEALEETLTKYLNIAAIDLDEDEQPHVIFETLNARGEPLRQSDLVKNTVMYEAGVVDDAVRARELWGMFEDEWWRGATKEGRITRIHLDRFLNYWMEVCTRWEVTADRVAATFREYINCKDSEPQFSIQNIAAEVRNAGRIYRDMVTLHYPGIENFLQRMATMEIGMVMPPLLWLFTSEVPDQIQVRSVKALESYLVRRMLCGLGTGGVNRLFVELLERLHAGGLKQADDTVIGYLGQQTVEQRIWPSELMLTDALTTRKMYGSAARQKMVLEAIEMHLSGGSAPLGANNNLTVQPIMPQKREATWDWLNRATDEEIEQVTKSVGNLTLIRGKLAPSLVREPWHRKQETLGKHADLLLNEKLLAENPVDWDEAAIWERSRQLAGIIAEIWPPPDKI